MHISKKNRGIIVKEFKYVADQINEHASAQEKIYYFSGAYAVVQRILNLEFDPDLIFLHSVLRQAYDSLNGRLQAIVKGGESVIQLTEEHFDKLARLTQELAHKIEESGDFYDALKKFASLTYSTTGNGFYLVQKGIFNIKDI